MPEFPRPIRLPGQPPPPAEPYQQRPRDDSSAVVDDDLDLYGAEDAAARLAERLAQVQPAAARRDADGRALLAPPLDPSRDRVDGPPSPRATLLVFGAHGTPASRPLGAVLSHVRERYRTSVTVAWRHYPDPTAHPRAGVLALAAEAAAASGRFWALTIELLHLHHHDPADLHAAILRAGTDPERTPEAMRSGTGSDRIVDDVASALASGVVYSPALFVNAERYEGDLDPTALSDALEAAGAAVP